MLNLENPRRDWLILRHVEHEDIGTLSRSLAEVGIGFRYVDLFRNDPVPERPGDFGGLIVMGGPMGVYESDRYPFLRQEQDIIRQAADSGLPVLGICLGAQLIASALGATVFPGHRKEIGWYPIEVTAPADDLTVALPPRFMGFHWHGDTFDLPPGAVRLFRSDLYENQGFRWGRNVLALQFHLEVNEPMINVWLQDGGCCAELSAVPDVTAEKIRQQTAQWVVALEELSGKLFRRYLQKVFEPVIP